MSRVVVVVAGLIATVLVAAPVVSPANALSFERRHVDALRRLAEPIEACIGMRDHRIQRPGAFRGCFDWHSAVHANLALRIIGRLTGEAGYVRTADRIASAEAMADEHALITGGALPEEVPYGYAWLLLLDAEADRAHIHAVAEDAATTLRRWVSANVDSEARALATRYSSSTFAIFALHRWYTRFAPERAATFAAETAPRLLGYRDAACADVVRRPGFLDPCASLLLALSQLADDEPVDRAALVEMAATVAARPILRSRDMRSIFEAGLNFSRSWALYAAARATGDASLVDAGDRLFDAHLGQPALWRESYAAYSHWVAQFGVFALDLRMRADGVNPPPTSRPSVPPGPLPPVGPPPISVGSAKQVAPSVWAF